MFVVVYHLKEKGFLFFQVEQKEVPFTTYMHKCMPNFLYAYLSLLEGFSLPSEF